jgi:hypothetical protein
MTKQPRNTMALISAAVEGEPRILGSEPPPRVKYTYRIAPNKRPMYPIRSIIKETNERLLQKEISDPIGHE